MSATGEGKYQLRTLHEEIDLFDRKLSHLLKYEAFATDSTRDAAAKKLRNRRELLVKTARRLAAEGVEFQQNELPRSFLLEDAHDEEILVADVAPVAVVKTRKNASKAPSLAADSLADVPLPAAEAPLQNGLSS